MKITERLKADKNARSTAVCAGISVLVVIVAAVAVPVALHNRVSAAEAAEPSVTVTEPTNAETTATVSVSETVTAQTVSETTEPTSAAPPMGNGVADKKENPKSPTKPVAQGTGNSSGAAAKQPEPNTPPAEPQKPNKRQWTQAEVDALVAEMKAYAKNRGFIIDSALTIVGTSWRSPSVTESAEDKIRSQLKYLIDESYDSVVDSLGYFPENMATINVVTQQYTDSDGYTQWEIYVVY